MTARTATLLLAGFCATYPGFATAAPVPASPGATDASLPPRYIVRFDDADSMSAAAAIGLIDRAGLDQVNAGRIREASASIGGRPMHYLHALGSGSLVVRMAPEDARRLSALRATSRQAGHGIRFVEPDRTMHAADLPNDPERASQWHYAGPSQGVAGGINVLDAWAAATGRGTNVAIIDTGYLAHPDLATQVVSQYDFVSDVTNGNDGNGRDADARDPGDWRNAGECGGASASSSSWHGTHVAGTVAAITNNGLGVAGIAYDARLVIARVLGKCGGYTSDIADGIRWSAGASVPGVPDNATPAQVLNMSLGGQYACSQSQELQSAISTANGRGATIVVAAGNSNADASNFSPASCPGVVTVAAVGPTGARAPYSNYGSVVDVAAPGGDMSMGTTAGVLSTSNSGSTTPQTYNYRYFQGTSMAAPHVAGVAALMVGLQPTLTPAQVEAGLKASTRAFPSGCSGCGTGIVDAQQALAQVTPPATLEPGTPVGGLSGTAGSSQLFVLTVPANVQNLNLTLTAGTGDAQLYLRRGGVPSATSYDCKPTPSGGVQTCAIAGAVTPGTYYVLVRGVTDYSDYTLLATFTQTYPGSLQFDVSGIDVTEAARTVTVTVTRTGGSDGAVSVAYATGGGTATAASDYTAKSGTLSWAAGDAGSKTFGVAILDDTKAEPTETLNLTLSAPTGGAALGTVKTATIGILDDSDSNPGTLAFAVTGVTVAEGTATVSLSVTRTNGANGAVGVTYATADDSAAAPGDYTAKSGTLSWASGDSAAKSLSVTLANDLVAESAESFKVALSAPTGGAVLGAQSAAVVGITDNDTAPGTLAFSAATYTAAENGGGVVVTVNRTGGSGGAVSVAYATGGGTAVAGSDYTATSGVLSWDAGDPTPKTFTVTVSDDATWESNETLGLTLSTPTGGATLGTQKTATATIADNDNNPGVVQFSAATYAVSEAVTTVTLTATRTGGNQGAVSVAVATADDSASAPGDYAAKAASLSWTSGDSANKSFSVTLVNDLVAESPESFHVALSAPAGGATLGAQNAATVTIADDDTAPGAFAFSGATYSVSESGGSLIVTVNRTGGSGGAVSVAYAATGGTATAGTDFTATSGVLSWDAADPAPKTFAIPVAEDGTWEPAETIALALSAPTGGATLGTQKSATASIVDNDNNPGVLQFGAATYAVTEGTATVTLTVTRTGGNQGAVSVAYATADDAATAPGDYAAKSGTLSWATGDGAAKTFSVTITNDLVAETTESFRAALAAPTGGATIGAQGGAVVGVADNDTAPGALAFSVAAASVAENGSTALVTVTRTGGSGGAVSVAYATGGGTAIAGTDYVATSGVLIWDAGDPSPKTFTVALTDDSVWEPTESIGLVLSAPTGGATLGAQKAATINITDNDNNPGVLQFSASSYAVTEGTASVTLTVTRTGGNQGAVSVGVATADDTATAPADYAAKVATLSWASGDSAAKTVSITIANDLVAESPEGLRVALGTPSGGATRGTPDTAVVAIADNDTAPGAFAFSATSGTIAENGGSAIITVNRTGGSGGAVSVDYTTRSPTGSTAATAGTDYTATSGTLSWEAGDPAPKTFSVPIVDDGTWEPTELVSLELANPTGGATLGVQSTRTLNISDNDNNPGTIQFVADTYAVSEGTTTVVLSVTRSGGNVGAVSVGYATADDEAVAGADYTAKSGTLSWASGDTSTRTMSISILNDALAEPVERFVVNLGTPTGGAVPGARNLAAIGINDND